MKGNYTPFVQDFTRRTVKNIEELKGNFKIIHNPKGIGYLNVTCSFDIETSSFYRNKKNHDEVVKSIDSFNNKKQKQYEKIASMYLFGFGINGKVVIGRTWEDLLYCFNWSSKTFNLNENKRIICYVHNLAYEFQFIRKHFDIISMFALKERQPIKVLTSLGIEFRDSLALSGMSLEKTCENLLKYKTKKLVGDLDYSLIRNDKTPLSDLEIQYQVNDVLGVMCYIQEKLENEVNILRIPLTKTGYVRKETRKNCFKNKKYKFLIQKLTLDVEEFKQLHRAFHGGFTHANAITSDVILYNVSSLDFASSYPYCLVCEYFPMSKCKLINKCTREEFKKYLNNYCCLFDVRFENLKAKIIEDNPISSSKCRNSKEVIENNGRVVSATRIETTITELDFKIIDRFYSYEKISISNLRIYKRSYLPTELVKTILEYYKNKTELKNGDENTQYLYAKYKELINSIFGMIVTNIVQPNIKYEKNTWISEDINLEDVIDKYNKDDRRFLYYPWGIWCTAHAQYNLFWNLERVREDYHYSDTDSLKITNYEKHKKVIDEYNNQVLEKHKKSAEFHNLDLSLFSPKDKMGVEHPIGVFAFEETYNQFKTLGAKRYMYIDDKKDLQITISGLNKKVSKNYILKESKKEKIEPLDFFTNKMYIPKGYTGKLIHTYIDSEVEGKVKDYLGNTSTYHELSYIHMEDSDYSLGLSDAYLDYLLRIKEKTIS